MKVQKFALSLSMMATGLFFSSASYAASNNCQLNIQSITTTGTVIPLEAYALENLQNLLTEKNYQKTNGDSSTSLTIHLSPYTEFYHHIDSYNPNAIICSAEIKKNGEKVRIDNRIMRGSYSSLVERCFEQIVAHIPSCDSSDDQIDARAQRDSRAAVSRPHSREMP